MKELLKSEKLLKIAFIAGIAVIALIFVSGIVGEGASSSATEEAMLEQWTGDSEKMLKSRIIVDSLLRSKNISVTPEEIEAQYAEIAEDGGMTVEEVKNHYSDPRSKEWLIEDTKEQKLYEELYKEVKVSKGDKVSFADLFAAK